MANSTGRAEPDHEPSTPRLDQPPYEVIGVAGTTARSVGRPEAVSALPHRPPAISVAVRRRSPPTRRCPCCARRSGIEPEIVFTEDVPASESGHHDHADPDRRRAAAPSAPCPAPGRGRPLRVIAYWSACDTGAGRARGPARGRPTCPAGARAGGRLARRHRGRAILAAPWAGCWDRCSWRERGGPDRPCCGRRSCSRSPSSLPVPR